MPQIQIKDFKGITAINEGLWDQSFSKYSVGMDLWGLEDNTGTTSFSIPGVMQNMLTTSAMAVSASTTITEGPRYLDVYPTDGQYYAVGATNPLRLYKTAGATTWALSADPGFASATAGAGLKAFEGSVYVMQNTQLSRWSGSAWTVAFGTLSTATNHPSVIFNRTLYIASGNIIDKVTSVPAFSAAALTLASELTIRSIEVLRDRIYISADNGYLARIFVWDGVSSTVETFFDLADQSTAPLLKYNDGVLWLVATSTAPSTSVYVYSGGVVQKIFTLPISTTSVDAYRGNLLIGSQGGSGYEDGNGGVWMIGRHNSSGPYQAVLAFNPGGLNSVLPRSLRSFGANILMGIQDGSTYQIHNLTTNVNADGIWQSLPIDAGEANRSKTWNSIRLNIEANTSLGSTKNVVIKYRLDYATTWTTLKTITATSQVNNSIPIGRSGNAIEIRIEMVVPAGGTPMRIHGFTLDFTTDSI